MLFLLLVLSRFDRIGGGMECVLGHSSSKVGMVTPSEGCVNGMFSGGVGSTGIVPGIFSLLKCWCVRGYKRFCVGAVVVDDVWVLFVGVAGPWSAVAPNIFANLYNAYPWLPWNV